MNIGDAARELVGDLSRFGPLEDRVEGLIDLQTARYRPESSDWLVVPWTGGFFLFSEDSEGQRRGREIVIGFLGPSVITLDTVDESTLQQNLPASWKGAGLIRASALRLVGGQSNAELMLSRLEDMVTALGGRTRHVLEIKPTHSDLLRDFRLALLRRDDDAARHLFDQVRLNGNVSAENLRYLRIEYLASFERWAEMRALPHLRALLQARRPRVVSETLLRMVWWTGLIGIGSQNAKVAFEERNVMATFGPLLRSVRVPSTQEGRLVGFLAALADDDVERQAQILECTADSDERARLQELTSESPFEATEPPVEPQTNPLVSALDSGRFTEVIEFFLGAPSSEFADLAVQAVLESGVIDDATRVLLEVRKLDAAGELSLNRRSRRDLEDLERLADDACGGWVEWSARLAGEARWSDASSVVRGSADSWQPLGALDSRQVNEVCDALLGTVGGSNDDQMRASLDVLCGQAATLLAQGSANDFCRTVLLLLSEQDNFSEMVRSAYLDLLAAWLEVGPSGAEYGEVIEQTAKIWMRVRSPNAVSWAISVLEATVDSPCPDAGVRTNFAVQVINDIRAKYYLSASLREQAETEDLAGHFGLPSQPIEASEVERDLWSLLNGKSIGIYSLLPRAKSLLESRLARLCSVGEIKGNDDEVGTQALRALASRADFLIVDTWHAAHQATAAIDAVRPRDRQVLPRQRGISGFLRALEGALGA